MTQSRKTLNWLKRILFDAVLVAVIATVAVPALALEPVISDRDVQEIAVDAYIYGYPLVTMEMTRRVMTNVSQPKGTHAPMGHFVRMRAYPTATFKDVTAPNADTLYTTAWLDVGREPYVLSLPDANGRYYLFPMLDGWTDVFQVPGSRTTGTKPQKYAITGPGWKGSLPADVTEYKSRTAIVWLLGRIYCTGTPEDYAAVHKMQDEVSVVPLSAYGKPYTPPTGTVDPDIDMKTPVRDQVNGLSTEDYFNILAGLLKDNPPVVAKLPANANPPAVTKFPVNANPPTVAKLPVNANSPAVTKPPEVDDAPMVAKMARLGIMAGYKFELAKFRPDLAQALQDVPKIAFKQITAHFKTAGRFENGWVFMTKAGSYGTDYIQRALVTAFGLGANRPQDAVYPTSEADAEGQPYVGTNKYVMHFDKDQMPPVNGFWSLTMYNAKYFFVNNPLNRYALSSRNIFTENEDGSVDLFLQAENPGADKEANWLPAPAGRFIPMLRLYWPKETPPSIIDGTWKIPAIMKVQ